MNASVSERQTGCEKFLRLPEVEAVTGLKKSSIYNGMHAGTFPSSVRLSARLVAWRERDLQEWQAGRQKWVSK